MRAIEVYQTSDGDVTKAYYAELETHGIAGVIAMNLFRAQKCSDRAKVYRGGIRGQGSFRRMAYDRKQWSMDQLCACLIANPSVNLLWGWKTDSAVRFGNDEDSWVLYVDLPTGQVSFHSPTRGKGPDYGGKWDEQKRSAERILCFCDTVIDGGAKWWFG